MPFRRLALCAAVAAAAFADIAAAGVLDRMKETGEIRLAVRADARPFSWLEGGAPQGYTVALCQQVAKRVAEAAGVESLSFTYVEVTVRDRFDAIAEGRADLLCGAATVTIERRGRVDFSIPTFVDGASVMQRADAESDFAALAGKKIGVLGGTTTEEGLRATLDQLNMAAEVVAVASHPEGRARLLAGEIDAYFADQSILVGLLMGAEVPSALRVARNVLTVEPHALAMPLGDTAFRAEVDRALSHLYRGGVVADLYLSAFEQEELGPAMKALTLVAPLPD